MPKIRKEVLAVLLAFLLGNAQAQIVALDSMLTACYPFTGNAQDMSGNNHHGTVFGATLTADRFGNPNCAYHFNGINNRIEVQHFDSLVPTDEVSLSFWCRVQTFASHAQFQLQPDDAADRFNVSVHYSHNTIPSTFWDYGSIFTTGRYDTLYVPFVTQWEHYVFISSANGNLMAEYKDGVLIKAIHQNDDITNKTKTLWIGSGSTLACMEGEIDDIRFYNRVLNDSEIVTLYTMTDACNITPPVAAFMASDTVICESDCISFTNFSQDATSWQWLFPGGTPGVSVDENPTTICYNTPGTYDVALIAGGPGGTDTMVVTGYITVVPYSQMLSIQQHSDTLVANLGFVSYQWYYNGSILSGATDYFYVATQSGDYNVICIDENGCHVEAVIYSVLAGTYSPQLGFGLTVFPNPARDEIYLQLPDTYADAGISISNCFGQKIRNVSATLNSGGRIPVDVHDLAAGSYLIEVLSKGKIFRSTFIKW